MTTSQKLQAQATRYGIQGFHPTMQVGILPRRFLVEERKGASTGQDGKGPTVLTSSLVAYPCR